MTKVYEKGAFVDALRGVGDRYDRVYVPVKEGDFYEFKPLGEGVKASLGHGNTRLSAKSVVYPQSERMFDYALEGDVADSHVVKEVEKDYGPQAVVGIRPCDADGFSVVKINFDNAEYRDPWWVRRYESTTFVGLGCTEPCESCFCTSVGGGPYNERSLDALMYDVGDDYLVKALTEKGEEFLSALAGGREAEPGQIESAEAAAASIHERVCSTVPVDKLHKKVQTELFDAPFWEEIAFGCINCGTCTYLCPTCWCFDIQDEVSGGKGDRIRNWDSCMFPLFTLHGSGHNPRDKKVQRVRQRFMHKLKYYVDKYGSGVQCTGCGRCVRQCPANIDIRRVAELMNGY